ncbi:MAG TPA: hypothetical protein VK463_17180 [Desulfomonilaceae bacterium]|nr:hypothetical protein [Desulfomonilaceae bacterium]
MTDDQLLATLIVDKEMIVSDLPGAGATLITQYSDRYVVFTITADRNCTLGFEGEPPVSMNISELVSTLKKKRAETLQ